VPPYPIRGIDPRHAPPKNRGVLSRVFSAALVGVEAVLIRVEVDVAAGLPSFTRLGCIATGVFAVQRR
jgi:hypothetical protein